MSEQSSASIGLQRELNWAETQTNHLINTAKILRGHKIRVRDRNKIRMLRQPHASPVKSFRNEVEQAVMPKKINEFTEKYKALKDMSDSSQIFKYITQQREKISRSSKERIKLFSVHKHSPEEDNQYLVEGITQSELNTTRGQSTKNNQLNQLSNTEINIKQHYDSRNTHFQSENIGKRLNQYLNVIFDQQKIQQAQFLRNNYPKLSEKQTYLLQSNFKQKPNNYVRKMKQSQKVKVSDQRLNQSLCDGELVKNMLRTIHTPFRKSRKNVTEHHPKQFNSMEIQRDHKSENTTRREAFGKLSQN